MRRLAALASVLALMPSITFAAEKVTEGNWFYLDDSDSMTNARSLTLGAAYGKSGALTFKCEKVGTKSAKITGIFVADSFLGEALHLQYLFVRFDEDEATRMVGNYPGQSLVYFPNAKSSLSAFERINTAKRVRVRAFRYDDTAVEADIALSPERNLWQKFRDTCLGPAK